MFSTWKVEKATAALVDAAQALADRLAEIKPHMRDSQAAAAQFWAVSYRAEGLDLACLTPAAAARFAKAAEAKITTLRKARFYDSSDGLTIWLHTARAVTEPRIAPAVAAIWRQLALAGPNAAPLAEDLLAEAGLPLGQARIVPHGIDLE